MNRYALWKYLVIVVAILLGSLYTLPNFFGEAPAVQVSSGKATINPWGSLAANDGSGPLRLGSIPANAWGFFDADRQHPRVVGASWAANTPVEPIHKKPLAWFFNGSVAPVETTDLQ